MNPVVLALRGLRPTLVRDARPGELVKVIGQVRVKEAINAPLSGRRCAAYHLAAVEHWSTYPTRLREEARLLPFELEDETGSVLIDIDRVRIRLWPEHARAADATTTKLTRRMKVRMADTVDLHLSEGALVEGRRAAAAGVVEMVPATDEAKFVGYREMPLRPVLVAPEGGAVLVSDEEEAIIEHRR